MQNLENFYKDKKVFITGYTGFKGSWLAYWLHMLGAKVSGYAQEPEYENSLCEKLKIDSIISGNIGDIRDLGFLREVINKEEPEIIFHLAAQALVRRSYEDPISTFSTNVMGSLNLLEVIRHNKTVKSLVYITSDKCYWNNEWIWGYRENDALGGVDPYSASKACAEHIFKSYYLSYLKDKENFGCASTRAGNVIGGGDVSKDRIVPDIISSVENNQAIVLRNPEATRPWQHVLDPLNGYLQLGIELYAGKTKFNGESWNFGPSNESIKTVKELTHLLTSLWSYKNVEVNMPDNLYESKLLHLSIEKAQTLLKWKPKISFVDAVTITGNWYKKIQEGEDPSEVTQTQIMDFMYG